MWWSHDQSCYGNRSHDLPVSAGSHGIPTRLSVMEKKEEEKTHLELQHFDFTQAKLWNLQCEYRTQNYPTSGANNRIPPPKKSLDARFFAGNLVHTQIRDSIFFSFWWATKYQRQLKDTCLRAKWTQLPYVFLCVSKLTVGKPRMVSGPDLAHKLPVENHWDWFFPYFPLTSSTLLLGGERQARISRQAQHMAQNRVPTHQWCSVTFQVGGGVENWWVILRFSCFCPFHWATSFEFHTPPEEDLRNI